MNNEGLKRWVLEQLKDGLRPLLEQRIQEVREGFAAVDNPITEEEILNIISVDATAHADMYPTSIRHQMQAKALLAELIAERRQKLVN